MTARKSFEKVPMPVESAHQIASDPSNQTKELSCSCGRRRPSGTGTSASLRWKQGKTIGGYGFHIYDDGGARWITIRYETEDAANRARDLIAKALIRAISATVHG